MGAAAQDAFDPDAAPEVPGGGACAMVSHPLARQAPVVTEAHGRPTGTAGAQVLGAVLALQTMVMARMPTTTASDTATGIL